MATLYITTQGASVYRRSGQFVVSRQREIIQNVPDQHVKRVVLVGNVNLTTPVISHCLENRIDVVFLSQAGRFRGRLGGGASRSVEIRRLQYARAQDEAFCLRNAQSFIRGKITNQVAFARRQNGGTTNDPDVSQLKRLLRRVGSTSSIESLLGIEGAASATYFKMFRQWVPQPFSFEKRSANPPLDPVNALLSLTYTLIYNRITSHLDLIGFDPYQGFFHQAKNGHAALASDLIEEFRPLVADPLVIRLVRRRQLKPSDFEQIGRGFTLTSAGRRVFFREFEAKLASKRRAPLEGNAELSFARIIERQAYRLARVIRSEEPIYAPYTLK